MQHGSDHDRLSAIYHDGKLAGLPTTNELAAPAPSSTRGQLFSLQLKDRKLSQRAVFAGQLLLFAIVIVQFVMLYKNFALAAAIGCVEAGLMDKKAASSASSDIPQYYQTKPELYPGTQMSSIINIFTTNHHY